MMADGWRPKTVDPLGQAMGVPRAVERNYEFWLDLRDAENTFAQMVVLKLFYAVRRVVDEAGKALPQGAGVQGLLFDEARYDRADTIGQDLPIILATATGYANATAAGQLDPLPAEVRAPRDLEALCTAKESLEAVDGTTAIALPPDDAMLWAVALTGLEECELEALERTWAPVECESQTRVNPRGQISWTLRRPTNVTDTRPDTTARARRSAVLHRVGDDGCGGDDLVVRSL